VHDYKQAVHDYKQAVHDFKQAAGDSTLAPGDSINPPGESGFANEDVDLRDHEHPLALGDLDTPGSGAFLFLGFRGSPQS
jgi:hypothetical protein